MNLPDQLTAALVGRYEVQREIGAVWMATVYLARDVTVRDRVRGQVVAGRSLNRIIASKPTAAFDATWGGGPIKADDFVRFAYADATKR